MAKGIRHRSVVSCTLPYKKEKRKVNRTNMIKNGKKVKKRKKKRAKSDKEKRVST